MASRQTMAAWPVALAVGLAVATAAPAGAQGSSVFIDGFESGRHCRWSAQAPAVDCTPTVLMFVAQEAAYYSEYVVMRAALEAAGYVVDLRSATASPASLYMLPAGTDIAATADTLPGSSYAAFQSQFDALFGAPWNEALNPTPATVAVDGSIADVVDMTPYLALVVVGGTGALDYRVDGSYPAQGAASALAVQAAAEKLNQLAVEALHSGKPVLGQCHAASVTAFWRVPGTSGPGAELLGYSLLKGQAATGFPEAATATYLTDLDIAYREADRVTVAGAHPLLADGGRAATRVLSSRDWYPQTVAHAARTLLNVVETYPPVGGTAPAAAVLVLHGGAVDPGNCHYTNLANDVPCNYGNDPANLPADYTDLVALLTADSPEDAFSFTVSELNLAGATLPFDAEDQAAVEAYLAPFDVVVFFKHWSTGMTDALQLALVAFADHGGGVVGLHHALYNQPYGSLNKDIVTQQLLGAESASGGSFSLLRTTYGLFHTDYGHFTTTYGLAPATAEAAAPAPAAWTAAPLPATANASFSTYHTLTLFDELYGNTTYVPGTTVGRAVNDVTPVLSNDWTGTQAHVSGFVRCFDPSLDGSVGQVAVFQAGERPESLALGHRYAQIVRNAVQWAATDTCP